MLKLLPLPDKEFVIEKAILIGIYQYEWIYQRYVLIARTLPGLFDLALRITAALKA